jgi:hypothetical protein
MPGGGDRKELGKPFDDSQDEGVKICHRCPINKLLNISEFILEKFRGVFNF